MNRLVRITDILVYYDGPAIFEGKDFYDGCYIGIATSAEDAGNLFFIVGVSRERLRQFRNGSIDLLDLIVERDGGDTSWFAGTMTNTESDMVALVEQSVPVAESGHLPESGFFLHDRKTESNVVTIARENKCLAIEISVEPPEAATEHRINVETLTSLLGHIQSIVKYAFKHVMKNSSPQSQKMSRNDYKLNVLVPAAPGSFKMVMGTSEEQPSFPELGGSPIVQTFGIIDELFGHIRDLENSMEIARKYKGGVAGAYLNLIKLLATKDTGLQYSWATAIDDTPKSFSIIPAHAKLLTRELSKITNLGTQTVVFSGAMEKADDKDGSWRIITDDGPREGKRRDGKVKLNGVVIGERYQLTCEEETECRETNEENTSTLYLVALEKETPHLESD